MKKSTFTFRARLDETYAKKLAYLYDIAKPHTKKKNKYIAEKAIDVLVLVYPIYLNSNMSWNEFMRWLEILLRRRII